MVFHQPKMSIISRAPYKQRKGAKANRLLLPFSGADEARARLAAGNSRHP